MRVNVAAFCLLLGLSSPGFAAKRPVYLELLGGTPFPIGNTASGTNSAGALYNGVSRSEHLSPIVAYGVKIGYEVNRQWSFDFEYTYIRNRLKWLTDYPGSMPGTFSSTLKSSLLLLNAYRNFDLGSIKPYLGLGVGLSDNSLSNISESYSGATQDYLANGSKRNFAYQVSTGANIALSKGWALDVSISAINLGELKSGDARTFVASGASESIGRYRFRTWSGVAALGLRHQF